MKLTVTRAQTEDDFGAKVSFVQEGMPGVTLEEWDIDTLCKILERIEENSFDFIFKNIGVRRQVESVTIFRRRAVDEVLLKLTHGKALKLASSLRASYPEYFR